MEPKQEIEQLTRELEHAGYLYYVLDNPKMSDYDYDHKLRRLEELEAQYPQYASPLSPTRRVGGQAVGEGQVQREAGGRVAFDAGLAAHGVHDVALAADALLLLFVQTCSPLPVCAVHRTGFRSACCIV